MKNIITLLVLLTAICFSAEKELPSFSVVKWSEASTLSILNTQDLVRLSDWKKIPSKVYSISEPNKEIDTGLVFDKNYFYIGVIPNPECAYQVTTNVGDMADLKVFVNWKGAPLQVERSKGVPDEAKEIKFNRLMFYWKGMIGYKVLNDEGLPMPSSYPHPGATLQIKLGGEGPVKEMKGSISFKLIVVMRG